MSLGSVSRARAIFNGVMSKNSCRVVLIALLMLCGSGSVFAQIKTGDIVTISNGTNYLAVNGNNIARVQNDPTIYCLWEVTVVNNQYAFKNVGDPSRYLRVEASYKRNRWTINLKIGDENNRSLFTLQNEKKLYYTATSGQNKANCYIRYNTNWTCSTNANATGTDLTIGAGYLLHIWKCINAYIEYRLTISDPDTPAMRLSAGICLSLGN